MGFWYLCADRPDCVHPTDHTDTYTELLRQEWSVFIRIQPPDADAVDLRVSLVGSAKAIDAVCPSPILEEPTESS